MLHVENLGILSLVLNAPKHLTTFRNSSAKVRNSVIADKEGTVTIDALDGLQYEILE